MTTAPSPRGAREPARRRGVFFLLRARFYFRTGTSSGVHDGLVSVQLVSFVNQANNAFRTTQMARVLDRRDDTPMGHSAAQMEVVEIREVGLLPFAADGGGPLLDIHPLTGQTAQRDYSATLVTDYQLSPDSSLTHRAQALTECVATSAGVSTTLVDGRCRVQPSQGLAADTLVAFDALAGSVCPQSDCLIKAVPVRIIAPTDIQV